LHVIFGDGGFDDLPHRIRQFGPRHGLSGGAFEKLKPHYRKLLAEQGFAVVYQKLAAFTAEPP